MKYILAVSGGVDSVVLLDMFTSKYKPGELIVAHFEHGIRGEESEADAQFVEGLSDLYRIECEIGHGHLSPDTSEAEARRKRYEFLRAVAKKHKGTIVTAHHQDDLIETVTLNLQRGTGWRGLAVFGDSEIERPLIHLSKRQIYQYALEHTLEWVEDETNRSDRYTRNRLRQELGALPEKYRAKIIGLYQSQTTLRREIEEEQGKFSEAEMRSRYFMTMLPDMVALELLRQMTESRVTRPQLKQLLLGIKTARPGTSAQIGGGLIVKFALHEFSIEYLASTRGESDII